MHTPHASATQRVKEEGEKLQGGERGRGKEETVKGRRSSWSKDDAGLPKESGWREQGGRGIEALDGSPLGT